ncbi:MAG: response regulator, partial [Phycisphaerales bacterium JB059]
VVLIDYRLRGSSGLEWLPDFTRAAVGPVIMMTSSGDERVASEAFKRGAMDYIDKETAISDPCVLEKAIAGAMRRYRLERTNKHL